jgi:hypothetical protein
MTNDAKNATLKYSSQFFEFSLIFQHFFINQKNLKMGLYTTKVYYPSPNRRNAIRNVIGQQSFQQLGSASFIKPERGIKIIFFSFFFNLLLFYSFILYSY